MEKTKKGISARKKPLQERAKFTVDAILKASAQLLERNGETGVSTNHIAERAGVSIGSLYQYFPNKDAILSALMESFVQSHFRMIEKTLAKVQEQQEKPDLESTTRSIIHSIIESNRKNSRLSKVFVTSLFRPERIKLLQEMDERMIEKFKEYIQPFSDQIRSDNVDMMFFVLIQAVKTAPVAVLFHTKFKLDDPRLEDELVRLALGLLRKDP